MTEFAGSCYPHTSTHGRRPTTWRDTLTDLWRIAKQLPQSEFARWLQMLANAAIVMLAVWAVLARSWRWARGKNDKPNDDDFEQPEGA